MIIPCPPEVRSKMLAYKLTFFLGGLIDWDAEHTTKSEIASGALDFTSNDAQERNIITPEDWGNDTLETS